MVSTQIVCYFIVKYVCIGSDDMNKIINKCKVKGKSFVFISKFVIVTSQNDTFLDFIFTFFHCIDGNY